jgi:hypothetical protein
MRLALIFNTKKIAFEPSDVELLLTTMEEAVSLMLAVLRKGATMREVPIKRDSLMKMLGEFRGVGRCGPCSSPGCQFVFILIS